MKTLSYEDIIEDEKEIRNGKVILKALTERGYILVEKFDRTIIAYDNTNTEIASTKEVNEKGFNWVKKQCRGWHGFKKLNWKVEIKKP